MSRLKDSRLARRLRRLLRGDVHFDAATRGRYATDASMYRIEPLGVVIPADETDVVATLELAREAGVPVLPRGAGTSLAGQAIGEALILDHSRHLNRIIRFDPDSRSVEVQPGVVLAGLNAFLRSHGLWFPVDVHSAAQATIGGMAANNSSGPRSIRYGNMVHNVAGIHALLSDGTSEYFGPFGTAAPRPLSSARSAALVSRLFAVGQRERGEIERMWPKLLRRVGGYNLDVFHPQSPRPYTADGSVNLAHLLVGSEGTLAWFRRITLALQPLPALRRLGIAWFPDRDTALRCVRTIVGAGASAVEYLDETTIAILLDALGPERSQRIRNRRFPGGGASAALLVEFEEGEETGLSEKWSQLTSIMIASPTKSVHLVTIEHAAEQEAVWQAYRTAVHRTLSRRGAAQPFSFIDDCAVALADLPDFAAGVDRILSAHQVQAVWSGPVSAGVLRVRPVLVPDAASVRKMRQIADEVALLVRRHRGAFSGESGDGIARGERVNWQFGARLERAFDEIKDAFDPARLFNPGKIVDAPRMDDDRLFRWPLKRVPQPLETAFDWSGWIGAPNGNEDAPDSDDFAQDHARGFAGAAAACNGNGLCRQLDAGAMCPSWRVTRDEKHLTRGRAHTLHQALATGRFDDATDQGSGPEGRHAAQAAYDALELCVGCKACRRECPAGIDMTRMKIEFLYHWNRTHELSRRDRLFAWLPRYAHHAARWRWLLHLRDALPGMARLTERWLGIAARRSLPRWRGDPFLDDPRTVEPLPDDGPDRDVREVVLWCDTFNNWFEPDNLRAARAVLHAAGYRVHVVRAPPGQNPRRPLCCGRTFLSFGLVDEARAEAQRTISALEPWIRRGIPVTGLEPACLLTMRDEFPALGLGEAASDLARNSWLFEEFLAREQDAGRLTLDLQAIDHDAVLLHGHCHQKAFAAMPAVHEVLRWIPGLAVREIDGSCCGMAGAFGYDARQHELSMRMGELTLLPAVRSADARTLVVADGTSCRHQIRDGAQRAAVHAAVVLERALAHRAATATTERQRSGSRLPERRTQSGPGVSATHSGPELPSSPAR